MYSNITSKLHGANHIRDNSSDVQRICFQFQFQKGDEWRVLECDHPWFKGDDVFEAS